MVSYPQFSAPLVARLRQALALIDDVALYNVTHDDKGKSILGKKGKPLKGKFSRGGPFGALLAVSVNNNLEIIGEKRGNNVIGKGIASLHAEDQALLPDNIASLRQHLSDVKKDGSDAFVWMVSSGQSCTTCHTKQEVLARALVKEKLLKKGHFLTLYGATYDQTFSIAQFYDAYYADAMIKKELQPSDPKNLIRHETIRLGDAPNAVRQILSEATGPTAIVMRRDQIYSIGKDTRDANNPFATAEVDAIRNACLRNRASGTFESWKVDGKLFTTATEIGPLAFAEMGWTKISDFISVEMPKRLARRQFDTRETPGLSNGGFLTVVANGYHHSRAAIRIMRDEGFINRAQPKWAEVLRVNKQQLYNGADIKPDILAMRALTRLRYAAHDICVCQHGKRPHRKPIPLAALTTELDRA